MSNKKFSLFENIELKGSQVTYNDFGIDPNISYEDQEWCFKEDIVQINFGDIYIIDIGFYPEFTIDGFFKIVVIRNFNWDKPIFKKTCKDVFTLKEYLQEAINFVDSLDDKKLKKKIKYFKNRLLKKVNLHSGKIVKGNLQSHSPFVEPIAEAKNTFLQIRYHDIYILEISWHPEFSMGTFKVRIANQENNNTIFEKEYEDIYNLEDYLQEVINYNESLIDKNLHQYSEDFLKNINLKNGRIVKNEFYISSSKSIEEQVLLLKNNMLRIRFKSKKYKSPSAFIDWHPEFDSNGSFYVSVDNDYFGDIIFEKKCREVSDVKRYLQEAIDLASKL